MLLSVGDNLGHYEVSSSLGVGGMVEVYRVRDCKLDRDVALKVLPESFANHPDRLARFQREARVLATIPTLPLSTDWKNRTAYAASSWSWSRGRRWPSASPRDRSWSRRRWSWRGNWLGRSTTRTRRESFIET